MSAHSEREAELLDVLTRAVAVIANFLPNIGHCVLQDYVRLNEVLIDSNRALHRCWREDSGVNTYTLVLGQPLARPDLRGMPPRHKQLAVADAWGMEVFEHPDTAPVAPVAEGAPAAGRHTDRPDSGAD